MRRGLGDGGGNALYTRAELSSIPILWRARACPFTILCPLKQFPLVNNFPLLRRSIMPVSRRRNACWLNSDVPTSNDFTSDASCASCVSCILRFSHFSIHSLSLSSPLQPFSTPGSHPPFPPLLCPSIIGIEYSRGILSERDLFASIINDMRLSCLSSKIVVGRRINSIEKLLSLLY